MFPSSKINGLLSIWTSIKEIPFLRYGVRVNKADFVMTRHDDDIFKMLMFLKATPSPRTSLKKALENLMVCTEVITIVLKNTILSYIFTV